MKGYAIAIVIGVLISVIAGVILYFLPQYLNPPNPIPVAPRDYPYEQKFFPQKIDFANSFSDFTLRYTNDGASSGTFTVSLSTDNILVRPKDPLVNFSKSAIKSWYMGKDDDAPFDFQLQINASEQIQNFTIRTDLSCKYDTSLVKGVSCEGLTRCAKYQLDDFASRYKLVSESCG